MNHEAPESPDDNRATGDMISMPAGCFIGIIMLAIGLGYIFKVIEINNGTG